MTRLLSVVLMVILAPGASAGMTITLRATAGNKADRRMYEGGGASAANDVNPANDDLQIGVNMTGPCRNCLNNERHTG